MSATSSSIAHVQSSEEVAPAQTIDPMPGLLDAMGLLAERRVILSSGPHAIWDKVLNAYEYLGEQLAELLSDGGAQ